MLRSAGPISALLAALIVATPPLDEPAAKAKAAKKPATSRAKPTPGKARKDADPKAEVRAKIKDDAFKVARSYLVLLDRARYGEAWDSMSADVKKGITRRKWVDLLGKTRAPFGEIEARKLDRVELKDTEVADRYDEAWVYAEFRAAEGATASELVVLVLQGGKDWTVNAYYIGDPSKFPKPSAQEDEARPASK